MASADDKMAQQKAALSAVVKGVNDFSVGLYLAHAQTRAANENILVSPLSASLATAMLNEGASGKTSDEILKSLHLPADKSVRDTGFSILHERLANTGGVTLNVANRIFVEKSAKLKEDYLNTVRTVHHSEITPSDFAANAEGERVKINSWVSNSTNNKINDLLVQGSVGPDSRLVLVNAVYFNGKWKEQFKAHETHPENFFVTKDNPVKVDMMHMSNTIGYAEIPELKARAVQLAYEGDQVAMQIILPNEKDGLPAMEEALKTFDLSTINFQPTRVHLSLPKFKLENSIDLKAVYEKMGMSTMFSPNADFSKMSQEPLAVSSAVQKTFMEVNEEGTEAAAATGFAIMFTSAMLYDDSWKNFVVDHPFFLALSQQNPLLPMFVGVVRQP